MGNSGIKLNGKALRFTVLRKWWLNLIMILELAFTIFVTAYVFKIILNSDSHNDPTDESGTLVIYLFIIAVSLLLTTALTELIINVKSNKKLNAIAYATGRTKNNLITCEVVKLGIIFVSGALIGFVICLLTADMIELDLALDYSLGLLLAIAIWLPINVIKMVIYKKQDYLRDFIGEMDNE